MKTVFLLLIVCQSIALCGQSNRTRTDTNHDKQVNKSSSKKRFPPDMGSLTKDFQTWYNYTYYHIHLAQDFIPIDTDSGIVSKKDFLTKMATGKYLPFETGDSNKTPVYRLYELKTSNPDIESVSRSAARQELSNDAMEGSALPDFSFTDVNGNVYNKDNTKGKLLMLKCWFIHCVACVAEFPVLNQIADNYRNNKDVLFISLARDSKQDLLAFLQKKPFKYAVVPQQEEYMSAEKINMFPTHILVDPNGTIIKVTNQIEDMVPALQKAINNH